MRFHVWLGGAGGRSLQVMVGDHSGNELYFEYGHVLTCVEAFGGNEEAVEKLSQLCDESAKRYDRWSQESPDHPQTYFIGLINDIYHDMLKRAKIRQKYLARTQDIDSVSLPQQNANS